MGGRRTGHPISIKNGQPRGLEEAGVGGDHSSWLLDGPMKLERVCTHACAALLLNVGR